ncbi:hypothetical protein EIN_252810 [Entamoeba invadens IP1]|uniref:PCI domain-containing protein n=1 Tax=Entamoeba invadens IP1 TaxID=370355 RepID=A0A0A1UHB6_ENTIV|nr:hypothetical protein EIN_252810 [Entamoeba invadens IP1]ELP95037.1 hypothetical protein EIN_252810 [Entamoeba invadens IP1]|eukprot:XP_004261808.1 hypothetical protein EIN_252810 [Entamoeba invadens IP1]
MTDIQELITGLKECMNYDVDDTAVIGDCINIIRMISKKIVSIYREHDDDLMSQISDIMTVVIGKMASRLTVVLGYILCILYHLKRYGDALNVVEVLMESKPLNFSVFIKASDSAMYGYYYGKLLIVNSRYQNAAESFERAYMCASPNFQEVILMYLVPLQLRRGKYVPRDLLEKVNNVLLLELCDVVSCGDVYNYEQLLKENGSALLSVGLYPLYNSLRIVVYRNLLDFVFRTKKVTKMHLELFVKAVQATGEKECDLITVQNMITNMASDKILKGAVYIGMKAMAAAPCDTLTYYQF